MLIFLAGVAVGLTVGTVAAPEVRALGYRIYNTVRLWLKPPPWDDRRE